MKLLIAGIALMCSMSSIGQVATRLLTSDLNRVDTFIKRNDKTMSYSLPKNYVGSPYFNDTFMLGKIYEGDELIAVDTPLRYNIYSNEIEVKDSLEDLDEDAKPLTKSSNIWVEINDTVIVLYPFNGSDEDGSYFQVLYEGKKVNFLKKVVKEFTTPKKASSSINRDLKGAFTDKNTFFLETKSGRLFELPKAKKKKFMVFGKHQDTLKEFAKKYNLNINKEPDLRRLILQFDKL